MSFTPSQQETLAIAPKITGALSMFGSSCIIHAIVSDKTKIRSTYHKILLTMSCLDVFVSFWFLMSTWPIPVGTEGVWAPLGNITVCTVQGFFIQANVGTPALNSSLGLYYLLVSRYKWSEEKVRSVEPMLLGGPLILSIGTAIAGLPLNLYNNANLWCWIAPFPSGCNDSARYGDAANCTRGDNAWIYRWAFYYGPTWANIVVATFSMLLVYWTVLQQERAVDAFQEDGMALRKQSKRIAWQAFWYIMAFYVTFTAPTIMRLLQTLPHTKGRVYYPVTMAMATLLPLQGFLNFIVYSRARFYKYRRENPSASNMHALSVAAFSLSRSYPHPKSTDGCPVESPTEMPQNMVVPTEAILQSEVIVGQ